MRWLVFGLVLFISATQSRSASMPVADSRFSVELRRGFNAATYATRDPAHPENWVQNFEESLQTGERIHTNSAAFVLGAQFGFSYRIAEFDREDQTLPSQQFHRALAMRGALARLKYEEKKRVLEITDSDVVRLLNIPAVSFSLWKSSVTTSDDDSTVVNARGWLLV
jgi:hypothetical protein